MRGRATLVAVLALGACGQGEIEGGETDTAGLGEGSTSVVTSGGGTTPAPGTTQDPATTTVPPAGSESTTGGSSAPSETTSAPDCADPVPAFVDGDGDGFGDEAIEVCEVGDGFSVDGGDCDDDDPDAYPGASEPCGGTDDLDCDDAPPAACQSCADLLTSGNGLENGVYTIDIDGPEGSESPFQVYCDQTTSGGGWTLLQRTVWDPALTDALQTTYVQWRTLTIGDPGSGAYRLRGELWDDLQDLYDHMLRIDLRRADDGSSCEPMFYFGGSGVLDVTETGTTIEGMVSEVSIVNAVDFSATDIGPSTDCVNNADAVPWFYGSCCSTCPRYQGSYWNEPHPMVSYVNDTADGLGRLETDVCSTPAEAAINGSVFRGANALEYYVR